MAIAACKPESQSLLRNRQQMAMVKESLNEGYCDISGSTDDFVLAGKFIAQGYFSSTFLTSRLQAKWLGIAFISLKVRKSQSNLISKR